MLCKPSPGFAKRFCPLTSNDCLPLIGFRLAVWTATQFLQLPPGYGFDDGFECVFERLTGLAGTIRCLACQDFIHHVFHALLIWHALRYPFRVGGSPTRPIKPFLLTTSIV
jgi:hypothetical protein